MNGYMDCGEIRDFIRECLRQEESFRKAVNEAMLTEKAHIADVVRETANNLIGYIEANYGSFQSMKGWNGICDIYYSKQDFGDIFGESCLVGIVLYDFPDKQRFQAARSNPMINMNLETSIDYGKSVMKLSLASIRGRIIPYSCGKIQHELEHYYQSVQVNKKSSHRKGVLFGNQHYQFAAVNTSTPSHALNILNQIFYYTRREEMDAMLNAFDMELRKEKPVSVEEYYLKSDLYNMFVCGLRKDASIIKKYKDMKAFQDAIRVFNGSDGSYRKSLDWFLKECLSASEYLDRKAQGIISQYKYGTDECLKYRKKPNGLTDFSPLF